MKAHRFFRYIWRINAIIIFLVAVAVIIGIGALIVGELWGNSARRRIADAAPVVQQDVTAPKLTLSTPEPIAGSPILRAELQAVSPGKGLASSSDSTVTHNLLFIDPVAGVTRSLLPTHRKVISQREDIDSSEDRQHQPLASLALVKTSEGDDTGELLVFEPSGRDTIHLGTGIRNIHSSVATGPSEFVIVFERAGKYWAARLAAAPLRKTSEVELSIAQLP